MANKLEMSLEELKKQNARLRKRIAELEAAEDEHDRVHNQREWRALVERGGRLIDKLTEERNEARKEIAFLNRELAGRPGGGKSESA